jgi:hypothetical protein
MLRKMMQKGVQMQGVRTISGILGSEVKTRMRPQRLVF